MPINKEAYHAILSELKAREVKLVAVSKTKPVEEIRELYELGQRDFGENYVQELVEKAKLLPPDIRWHFIGHLQTNKVKLIAPFVQLIQSVDSLKLLEAINKQALKHNRIIDCLLQVHIAKEESKFGFDEQELKSILPVQFDNLRICGLMGMASFTADLDEVGEEFDALAGLFNELRKEERLPSSANMLSMGMSSDFRLAITKGSNMVRIGSLLFGERTAAL